MIKKSSFLFVSTFVYLLFLPNFLFNLFPSNSVGIYSGIVFIPFIFFNIFKLINKKISLNILILIFIIIFSIVTHLAISFSFNFHLIQHDFIHKALFSIPLVVIFLITAYLFAYRINKINFISPLDEKPFIYIYLFLCLILVLSLFFNDFFLTSKNSIIFSEPSKFYSIFSLITLSLILSYNDKPFIIVVLLITYFLTNLFFYSFLSIFYLIFFLFCLRINFLLKMLVIPISIIFLSFFILNNEYFYSRIFDPNNLSHAVFYYYYNFMLDNLLSSNFIGFGFQSLGYQDSFSFARGVNNIEYNRYDGSFLLAKIITDFGIFGIFFVLYYIYKCTRLFLIIFNSYRSKMHNFSIIDLFFISSFLLFFIDIFFRSYGYFTSTSFLFLASFLYLKNKRLI